MNNFFGYSVVEKLKFTSFDNQNDKLETKLKPNYVTNNKFNEKIKDVKNEKLKQSLAELTKVFKQK